MRCASLALLVPALVVAGGQDNEAEKLFRDLEKKITSAEAVHVVADAVAQGKGIKKQKLRSALTFARGNKARLNTKGVAEGASEREVVIEGISDGKTMQISDTPGKERHSTHPTPPYLTELLGVTLTRAGAVGLGWEMKEGEKLDLNKKFPVKDFKMGAGSKVNGRDAKAVHYCLMVDGKDLMQVTLWLDARTLLPLKRLIVAKEMENDQIRITETYSEFKINPPLKAKTFELPR
jgi:outer membrane lipoprotein-sorting protein